MHPPCRHHYLPASHLKRWAKDGLVWRFERVGPQSKLDRQRRAPKAIGFQKYLYSFENPQNGAREAYLETDFMQLIDDAGAKSIDKFIGGQPCGDREKGALVQFTLSLIYRRPSQIERLVERLRKEKWWAPVMGDASIRNVALSLIGDLIASEAINAELAGMHAHLISLPVGQRKTFLLCDAPVLSSPGTKYPEAFIGLPLDPQNFLLFARQQKTVDVFASYPPGRLCRAWNNAIVRQAESIIISDTSDPTDMIERQFLKSSLTARSELTGIAPWALPAAWNSIEV